MRRRSVQSFPMVVFSCPVNESIHCSAGASWNARMFSSAASSPGANRLQSSS